MEDRLRVTVSCAIIVLLSSIGIVCTMLYNINIMIHEFQFDILYLAIGESLLYLITALSAYKVNEGSKGGWWFTFLFSIISLVVLILMPEKEYWYIVLILMEIIDILLVMQKPVREFCGVKLFRSANQSS